jgi:hypothetical protein
MDIATASNRLWELKPREHLVVYVSRSETQITATRTDKVCPHDFAVGLIIPGRSEFYPTHIRLLFDLYLKRLSSIGNARKSERWTDLKVYPYRMIRFSTIS